MNLKTNRMFTLFLKMIRNMTYVVNRLKLKLEVRHLGAGCKIMNGVMISGGKNISIGSDCFIGRNVSLDASQGPITIQSGVEIRDHVRIYAGDVVIGEKVTLGEGTFLHGKIHVAPDAWISRHCDLDGVVTIEKAILGPKVSCVGGADHPMDPDSKKVLLKKSQTREDDPNDSQVGITICEGSWIGLGSIILKGVKVSRNMIVGAGSVCTKTFPQGSRVVGSPAREITAKK